MTEFKTLAGLMDNSAKKYGPRKLFGYKVRGEWQWITYSEFHEKMGRLRAAFHEMGMKSGDVVAIISNNSVPFALTAYAAYGLGASIVPMYEVQKSEDWNYIIRDCGARFVFVGRDSIRDQIAQMEIGCVERIISFRPEHEGDPSIDAMIAAHPQEMPALEVDENAVADILYTSGTTGMPKGVELTHRNIVQNSVHTFAGFDASCEDRSLSFLPWAHAFGKTVELHIFPYFGASIAIAESPKALQQNLREVQPTILNGVPKIFNKFYDKIQLAGRGNPLTAKIFDITDDLSLKSHNHRLSFLESAGLRLLNRVLGPKIHDAFGGKLRFCISGGAPLSPEVIQFFDSFGITIFEGYGMTETAPIVAVNKHGRIRIGSVGRVLDCNTVRIAPVDERNDERVGEVVVGGQCVMKQYHNAPDVTAEVLSGNHEFRTGDLGYIDEAGYLYITGRVKEQYKLENGKYVVPGALEEKLCMATAIDQAVIFGSGHPYNVALVRPEASFLKKFIKENKLEGASQAELEINSKLNRALFDEVQKISANFRGYEKPQKIAVILDEFTIQNGMLSQSLKLKRREIEKKYKAKIDSLYI